jgi:hypothetical protein
MSAIPADDTTIDLIDELADQLADAAACGEFSRNRPGRRIVPEGQFLVGLSQCTLSPQKLFIGP